MSLLDLIEPLRKLGERYFVFQVVRASFLFRFHHCFRAGAEQAADSRAPGQHRLLITASEV